MRILLATSNPHKLDEIRSVFDACRAAHGEDGGETGKPMVELVSLADIGVDVPEPVEDGDTFEANAMLKACYYAAAGKMHCLADDSGLEVDALGGEPGVYSARYAGVAGPRAEVDAANNRLLIKQLGDTPIDQRTARFVCAMALCAPHEDASQAKPLAMVRGTIEGRILTREEAGDDARGRGENGFGYDPLFYVPARQCTTAELPPAQKNAISHRGHAARLMYEQLRRLPC